MKPVRARPASKADETTEFKELWDKIWPTFKSPHDARALARDAFFRHVWWKDADPKDIVDAARYYVRTNKAGECRLLLRNWLDRGFYEDLASLERAYQLRHGAGNSNDSSYSKARQEHIAAEIRRSERSFQR